MAPREPKPSKLRYSSAKTHTSSVAPLHTRLLPADLSQRDTCWGTAVTPVVLAPCYPPAGWDEGREQGGTRPSLALGNPMEKTWQGSGLPSAPAAGRESRLLCRLPAWSRKGWLFCDLSLSAIAVISQIAWLRGPLEPRDFHNHITLGISSQA